MRSIKALIIGDMGELLTEKLKKKLEALIQLAVNEYGVTDFYFGNDEGYEDDIENEEKPYLKKLLNNSHDVLEFITKTIKSMQKDEILSSIMVVARPKDTNFDEALFDEVIQAYSLYFEELDCDDSIEAFDLRNRYLVQNVDYIFWYSNKILSQTDLMIRYAETTNTPIIYL